MFKFQKIYPMILNIYICALDAPITLPLVLYIIIVTTHHKHSSGARIRELRIGYLSAVFSLVTRNLASTYLHIQRCYIDKKTLNSYSCTRLKCCHLPYVSTSLTPIKVYSQLWMIKSQLQAKCTSVQKAFIREKGPLYAVSQQRI